MAVRARQECSVYFPKRMANATMLAGLFGRASDNVIAWSRRYYQVTDVDMAGLYDFAPHAEGNIVLAAELGQRVQDTRVS